MSYERYLDWLSEARDDFETAEDLFKLKRYAKACFFAQQTAEKALKALLMKRCRVFERSHSIRVLLERAKACGIEVPEELFESARILDRHYIPTRYPNAWPAGAPHEHYVERDAAEAIAHARKILEFVEREVTGDS